jgi:hypothetical protein
MATRKQPVKSRRKRIARGRKQAPVSRRKHSAKAKVQVMELSKAGTSIELELFADQEKLGRLIIGRGSLTWFGSNWKKGRRFSWSQFAAHMEGTVHHV